MIIGCNRYCIFRSSLDSTDLVYVTSKLHDAQIALEGFLRDYESCDDISFYVKDTITNTSYCYSDVKNFLNLHK
jgi:hypothetical protein